MKEYQISKKEEMLAEISKLYDESIEIIESDDHEKLLGKVVILSSNADKDPATSLAAAILIQAMVHKGCNMRQEDTLDPDIEQTFHDFDELIAGQPDGHEHCEEQIPQKTVKLTKKKCTEEPELCYEEWQKAQRVPGRIISVTPRELEINLWDTESFDEYFLDMIEKRLKTDEFIGMLKGNSIQYRMMAGMTELPEKYIKKAEKYEQRYEQFKKYNTP